MIAMLVVTILVNAMLMMKILVITMMLMKVLVNTMLLMKILMLAMMVIKVLVIAMLVIMVLCDEMIMTMLMVNAMMMTKVLMIAAPIKISADFYAGGRGSNNCIFLVMKIWVTTIGFSRKNGKLLLRILSFSSFRTFWISNKGKPPGCPTDKFSIKPWISVD